MRRLIYIIIICLFCARGANAACVADGSDWASTPDLTSVASCVTQADAGDTITVSAGDGTETWTSTLTIAKGINLIGPGSGNLTITSSSNPAISYSPSVGAPDNAFRLSGFTFKAGTTNTLLYFGNINNAPSAANNNKLTKNRVDHCVFTQDTLGADTQSSIPLIWLFLGTYGVIDNNTFNAHQYAFRATSNTSGIAGWNYWGWTTGTSDAVFVENNTFNYAYTGNQGIVGTSSQSPHRWVFRYNTFNVSGSASSYSFFDAHGNNANDYTSVQLSVLYGNKFVAGTKTAQLHGARGGQAFVFYNDWQTTGSTPTIKVQEEYADDAYGPATNAITGQPQHLYNSFFWNNRKTTTGALLSTYVAGTLSGVPAANVDYFNQTDWVSNGSAGVGCGSELPATCTANSSGYWLTAQSCSDLTDFVGASPTTTIAGTLYKCTSNNVWSAYYSPYTYPHPLRTDDSPPADTTRPAFSSASISTSGEVLSLTLTEDVTVNTNTGFAITCSGGAATLTYSSYANRVFTYAISRPIQQAEGNCTLAYTTGANYIEDAAGNDLDSFTGQTVVNNSTQNTPPLATLTITAHTGATVISSPSGINCGSTCSYDFDTNTPVVIQGYCLANYQNPVISGDCNATTGAVTMSAAKSCAYSCSKIAADAVVGSGAGHAVGTGAAHYIY